MEEFMFSNWFGIFLSWLALFLVLLIIRKVLLKIITKSVSQTKTKLDDIIFDAIRMPSILICALLSVWILVWLGLADNKLMSKIDKGVALVLGIAIIFTLAKLLVSMMRYTARKRKVAHPVTTLTDHLIISSVWCVGILIILKTMGISITPVITALGVGGLAVALALQDTLANFFAGFYTMLAKQVRVGDYVKLESGVEGYIEDISWRSTRIRNLPNNRILVPNTKLASSIVTNYYLPDPQLAVLVNVGVDYSSDLKHVEKVTCEVAKEAQQKVTGAVSDFEPFIRFHTFSDFSINFTVILRAEKFVDRYLLQHEFVKMLHERYNKEGIVIPFPIRTVHMESMDVKT